MSSFLFKNILVLLVLPAAYYVLWRVFRDTWRELDEEAHAWQTEQRKKGVMDFKPWAVFAIGSVVLAWKKYYGKSNFYCTHIRPLLDKLDHKFPTWVQLAKYEELYDYIWWELGLVLGYVAFPFIIWKILFPKDALLDFGLRTRGFFQHIHLYSLFLLLAILGVVIASFQASFCTTIPAIPLPHAAGLTYCCGRPST